MRTAAHAALLLPLVFMGCSSVVPPKEDAPASGPDPAYSKIIDKHLNDTFKDVGAYNSFEISELRWVHSVNGWSWLTCVRFQDHGHPRTYALYIKGDEVINSRFAVETDGCDAQNYSPFAPMSKATVPASGGALAPLY